MSLERDICIEHLGLGEINTALEKAKQFGLSDLAENIEASILKDKASYLAYYEQVNNREAGFQIKKNGFNLDSRQVCAFQQVKELESDNLLDIGCADGTFIFNCLHKNIIKQGVGVDAYKEGISWAKEFGEKNFPGRTLFFQNLFENVSDNLSNCMNPFKAIHIGEVLEHVLDPVDILCRAKTLLSPTGAIVITVPVKRPPLTQDEKNILTSGKINEHIRYINKDKLAQYAKESGLKIVKDQIEGVSWVNLIATLA